MISGFISSVKSLFSSELEVEESGDSQASQPLREEERKGLWGMLSSLIGMDVTSMISLPVYIFEPLSFLQIMAEPMQFEELLEKVAP
jgi:hypothetical protein